MSDKIEYTENKEEFARILLKTPFEKHTDELFKAIININNRNELYKRLSILKEKNLLYNLQIAEKFFLLKNNNDIIMSSSIQKSNCVLLPEIKNILIDKIEKLYEDIFIYDEACKALESNDTNEWKIEYKNNNINQYIDDDENYINDTDYYDNNMIKAYIDDKQLYLHTTIDDIKLNIKELKTYLEPYSKQGAPIKNEKLYAVLRIFTKYGCSGNNSDLRVIYDCLCIFDLVDTQTKNIEKYMRMNYNRSKEKDNKGHFYNETLIF